MSNGWQLVPLGEVLSVQNGFAFKSKEFSETEGMPLVRIRDLKNGAGTVVNYLGDYDEQYVVEPGDLLIGMDGEFQCHEWQGKNALLNQRVCKLINFSDNLLPRFLFFGINKYLKEIENRTPFTTVKHLSSKTIKSILFPVPPLEEQRRIVTALDEVFEGLDSARAHAEANIHAAQELFERQLASIFEEIVSDAQQLRLGDAATEFGRGRSRHRPRNDPILYDGDFPFIQTGDVRNCDSIIVNYAQTYNELGLAQSRLWPEGTVCITIAANIAETGILGIEACFPDSVIGMICDREVTFPEYVEFMLRYFAVDLKAQGKGSAQDNINLGTFERSVFPFPSLERQRQAVNYLQQLSDDIDQLSMGFNSDLSNIDDLRQSLLQRAFAGELT